MTLLKKWMLQRRWLWKRTVNHTFDYPRQVKWEFMGKGGATVRTFSSPESERPFKEWIKQYIK